MMSTYYVSNFIPLSNWNNYYDFDHVSSYNEYDHSNTVGVQNKNYNLVHTVVNVKLQWTCHEFPS